MDQVREGSSKIPIKEVPKENKIMDGIKTIVETILGKKSSKIEEKIPLEV